MTQHLPVDPTAVDDYRRQARTFLTRARQYLEDGPRVASTNGQAMCWTTRLDRAGPWPLQLLRQCPEELA